MSLVEKLEKQNNQTFSLEEYGEIFLGAIISGVTDGEEIQKAKIEFFYKDTLTLFLCVKEIFERRERIDYLSVLTNFGVKIGTDKAKNYINHIIGKVPNEYDPLATIQILEEINIKRQAIELVEKAKALIQKEPLSAPDVLFTIYEKVDSLIEGEVEYKLSDEIEKEIDSIVTGIGNDLTIKTGLKAWDSVSGGLPTQEVTIIGGRPGHGKTSICISFAKSILNANPDIVVNIFELEMSKKALYQKLIGNEAEVDTLKMRTNELTPEEKERVKASAEQFKKYEDRLYVFDDVYDQPTMHKLSRHTKAQVILIDFITLMDGMDEEMLRRELGRVTKRAKRFAKLHNIAYVFFSQLNRSVEARETKRPQSSDIAESDAITQLASDIILLFYQYKYTQNPQHKNKLRLIFDKVRYGGVQDKIVAIIPEMCIIKD